MLTRLMQSEKLPRARGVNRVISLRGTSVDAIHSLLALIQFQYSPKDRYYEMDGYAQNGPVNAEGVLLVDGLFRQFSATEDARAMLTEYTRAHASSLSVEAVCSFHKKWTRYVVSTSCHRTVFLATQKLVDYWEIKQRMQTAQKSSRRRAKK